MDAPRPYPAAERMDLVEDLHGHRVPDPYRRLETVAFGAVGIVALTTDQLAFLAAHTGLELT